MAAPFRCLGGLHSWRAVWGVIAQPRWATGSGLLWSCEWLQSGWLTVNLRGTRCANSVAALECDVLRLCSVNSLPASERGVD